MGTNDSGRLRRGRSAAGQRKAGREQRGDHKFLHVLLLRRFIEGLPAGQLPGSLQRFIDLLHAKCTAPAPVPPSRRDDRHHGDDVHRLRTCSTAREERVAGFLRELSPAPVRHVTASRHTPLHGFCPWAIQQRPQLLRRWLRFRRRNRTAAAGSWCCGRASRCSAALTRSILMVYTLAKEAHDHHCKTIQERAQSGRPPAS